MQAPQLPQSWQDDPSLCAQCAQHICAVLFELASGERVLVPVAPERCLPLAVSVLEAEGCRDAEKWPAAFAEHIANIQEVLAAWGDGDVWRQHLVRPLVMQVARSTPGVLHWYAGEVQKMGELFLEVCGLPEPHCPAAVWYQLVRECGGGSRATLDDGQATLLVRTLLERLVDFHRQKDSSAEPLVSPEAPRVDSTLTRSFSFAQSLLERMLVLRPPSREDYARTEPLGSSGAEPEAKLGFLEGIELVARRHGKDPEVVHSIEEGQIFSESDATDTSTSLESPTLVSPTMVDQTAEAQPPTPRTGEALSAAALEARNAARSRAMAAAFAAEARARAFEAQKSAAAEEETPAAPEQPLHNGTATPPVAVTTAVSKAPATDSRQSSAEGELMRVLSKQRRKVEFGMAAASEAESRQDSSKENVPEKSPCNMAKAAMAKVASPCRRRFPEAAPAQVTAIMPPPSAEVEVQTEASEDGTHAKEVGDGGNQQGADSHVPRLLAVVEATFLNLAQQLKAVEPGAAIDATRTARRVLGEVEKAIIASGNSSVPGDVCEAAAGRSAGSVAAKGKSGEVRRSRGPTEWFSLSTPKTSARNSEVGSATSSASCVGTPDTAGLYRRLSWPQITARMGRGGFRGFAQYFESSPRCESPSNVPEITGFDAADEPQCNEP
mmetsp:Transcript_15944/g.34904  ORF Transcript_15944/g.34904 Transcript_15944/m.34904 type:complete len:666 (+) Transcript_15944:251-2248(+)